MKIIISRLPNVINASGFAIVPLCFLLLLIYGTGPGRLSPLGPMLSDYLGPELYLIYAFLYLGCFIIIYLYLSKKTPKYLELQGECLYVGYRNKAEISIKLREIKQVEQWEPTTLKQQQQLIFKLDGREFTIKIDKKTALSISEKLEVSGINVRYKFYN